jgi:Heparan-alpha-glucosaminide N-acetyltransferase, catalytic
MSAPPTLRIVRPSRRLLGLDQARGIAILAMLAAHFAPGVFGQVPRLEFLQVAVLAFARLATPTFVVVFGITIGFVYLPRYLRDGAGPTNSQLGRRAAILLLCAVVIALPLWGRLFADGDADPWLWFFGLYSVLLFYVLALANLPAWLRWLAPVGRNTLVLTAKCLIAGIGLWGLGTAGHRLVPQGPPSGPEFVRMMLASGSYAYLQMMGTALLAIPIGWSIRRSWEAGTDRPFLGRVLVVGVTLAILGGLWGWIVGEYDLARLLAGDLRTPPRAWYFLHIGGFGLALIPALELTTRTFRSLRPAAYLLALFGQVGLIIFTGHVFILPGLAVADRYVPLHGAARVATALLPLVIFCGLVMFIRHRQITRAGTPKGYVRSTVRFRERSTSSPASTPSMSAHCPPWS